MFKLADFIKKLKFSKKIKIYLLNNIAEMHNSINLAFLEILVNQLKMKVIFVTLNKPYPALLVDLKRRKINHNKIFVIDCISGKKQVSAKNCIFVQNPASLFELSHTLSEIKKSGKYQFVFIDAMMTLFLHYPEQEVINFIRFHAFKTTQHLGEYMVISSRYNEKTKKLFKAILNDFENVKLIESGGGKPKS